MLIGGKIGMEQRMGGGYPQNPENQILWFNLPSHLFTQQDKWSHLRVLMEGRVGLPFWFCTLYNFG